MKSNDCKSYGHKNENDIDDGFEPFVAFDSLLNTLDSAALVSTRTMKQKRKKTMEAARRSQHVHPKQPQQQQQQQQRSFAVKRMKTDVLTQRNGLRHRNHFKGFQYPNDMKSKKDNNAIILNRNQIAIHPTNTKSALKIQNNHDNTKEPTGHSIQNKDSIETSRSIKAHPSTQSLPMTIDSKAHHPLYRTISFQNNNDENSSINAVQTQELSTTRQANTTIHENAPLKKLNHDHLTDASPFQSFSWISQLYSRTITSRENRLGKIGFYASAASRGSSRSSSSWSWSGKPSLNSNCHSITHRFTQSDTVRLDLGPSPSLSSCTVITCMEFDQNGNYLAVGDSLGYIRIYDFEEIHAADITNSNAKQSHTNQNTTKKHSIKKRKIIPCVTFYTGHHRVANITWCPPSSDNHRHACQDLLAVSFSNYKEVRIYDLSTTSDSGPRFISLNDSSNVRGSGHTTLTFLNGTAGTNKSTTRKKDHHLHLMAGGSDGTVRVWCLPKQMEGKAKLVWSYNPWNSYDCGAISDIIHLPSFHITQNKGIVLIATSVGNFAILNLDQLVHRSFSVSVTPEVVSTWSLSQMNGLRNTSLPNDRKWIGVKRCFPIVQLVSHKRLSLDCLIVTNAGWVLSMKTSIEKNNSSVVSPRPLCKILYQTPKMEMYSSTGEYYGQDQTTSCVPYFDSIAAHYQDCNVPTLIITGIKPDRKYLASSDQRVLDSSASSPILRKPNELLFLNERSLQTFHHTTIPTTTTINSVTAPTDTCMKNSHSIRLVHGSPTHIAFHPGNGFMVVVIARGQGVGGSLQSSIELFSLRTSRQKAVPHKSRASRNKT